MSSPRQTPTSTPSGAGNSSGDGTSYSHNSTGSMNSVSGGPVTPHPGMARHASFSPQMPQTYANRAAQAIKTSNIAQRFGKALYGSSSLSGNTSANARVADQQAPGADLKFTARSGVLAMGMSPEGKQAAIAGRDFFQILDVDQEISVAKDLRQSRETRDFDKMYSVTALKWGYQMFNHHVALGTSGGNILLYNLQNPSGKDSVMEFRDSNRYINTLAFSQSVGHVLYSGLNDGRIQIWDLRLDNDNRKPSITFQKPTDSAREVQCSPHDNRKFAVIYDTGIIQRWDIRNPKQCDKRLSAHTSVGLSLDWHPDHDYIVSGGRDKLIQVWNMSKETRDADYVILAPSAVSKVRWQIDNNASQHARRAASGVLNTCIASCGRGKYDYCTYVWNPRRPFIPVNVLETHSDSVSEVQWGNDKMLWTASRDKTFMQHDLTSEPLFVDNISSRAFSWSAANEVTFMVQDKYREQFGSVYNYRMRSQQEDDVDDFHAPTATTISTTGATTASAATPTTTRRTASGGRRPGSSSYRAQNRPIQDVDYNQAVCFASFGSVEPEVFRYLAERYTVHSTKGENMMDLCDTNAKVAAACGKLRTAQTWMVLKNSMQWEVDRYYEHLREEKERLQKQTTYHPPPTQTRAVSNVEGSKKHDFLGNPDLARLKAGNTNTSSTPSTPLPISSGFEFGDEQEDPDSDEKRDSEESEDAAHPIEVPPQRKQSTATDRSVDSYLDDVQFSSYGTTAMGSSPDQSRLNPEARVRSLSTDYGVQVTKLGAGFQGLGIDTIQQEEPRRNDFQKFLDTLNHPWKTADLVRKAAEYALHQGDIQLCAVLGVLFLKLYPDAFPSANVVEEWVFSYVELLKRCQLFTAAAEVIKGSEFNSVRDLGLTETQVETLCHRCMCSLAEYNTANDGYWYCAQCQKLLDGCVLCRQPVKGLATALIQCGHKIHIGCMKSWLFGDGMKECPSGCGTVIAR